MTSQEWTIGYIERLEYALEVDEYLEGLGYTEPATEWLTGEQARTINDTVRAIASE